MSAAPRLALGTVHFGLAYGLGKGPSPLPRETVREILSAAWAGGIDMLDTAAAYGDAERAIGESCPSAARFAVVSKLAPMARADFGAAEVRAATERARESVRLLGVPALDALLVHHAPDLLAPGGAALSRALEALRAEGVTRRIGVSVYDAATLNAVLGAGPIQLVQLPLNVLDQRFLADGTLAALARRGIEVHVRSVFLQGALLADPRDLAGRAAALRRPVERFQAAAAGAGLTPAAAALAFVARCRDLARVIVGVDSAAQLRADAAQFAAAREAPPALDFGAHALADPAPADPRSWS